MEDDHGMKNLVFTINKLQEIFKRLTMKMDVDLPQIAVVGIQSSGKSSVLEKFIGREFLPRGSGIVTRRPLILQLINDEDEYAKFDHSNEIFDDFSRIQKEIEDETERVVGNLKAVSDIPIVLKVYSPNVLNLTLIDLPGITKVPIGDQPTDIEHQIREMIVDYINKESCLILAVTPANIDLANSEALKLAREVDPNGVRTIGVITKLDLMDEGTNAVEVLENRIFPLKRGYVGVVNRSQREIDEKLDLKLSAEAEQDFFENHPAYRHMSKRMGTSYLQKILNKQLVQHIFNTLPALRDKLRKHQMDVEDEYEQIEKTTNVKLMNDIITQLKREFRSELDGYGPKLANMKEHNSGTVIHDIFNIKLQNDNFTIRFGKQHEKEFRSDIAVTIRNTTGFYSNIFIPEKAFDRVAIYYIEKMKKPVEKYVDEISGILQSIVRKYTDKISRFPNLREELRKLILSHIAAREKLCKERFEEMIDSEMSYINKIHEDFHFENLSKNEEIADEAKEDDKYNFAFKGYMQLTGGLVSTDKFWFVLTIEKLMWYRDESEKDLEGFVQLLNLRLSEYKGKQFKLVDAEGKIIYKDSKSLKLVCETAIETKEWLENFASVGVVGPKSSSATLGRGESIDSISMYTPETPQLVRRKEKERKKNEKEVKRNDEGIHFHNNPSKALLTIDQQVDTIKTLVENYLAIVIKNSKDRMPKMLTWLLINNVNEFMDKDLTAHFYQSDSVDHVMQKPPAEQERIENVKTMYTACKEALEVIDKEYERMTVKYFD